LNLTPEAKNDDGLLDICMFQKANRWNVIKYFFSVLFHLHQKLPDCKIVRATHLRIESDEKIPFQIDGDLGGELPATIEIVPRHLRLCVSEKWWEKMAKTATR
jgi:diacylglycerol kinase family enzyme